MTGFGSVLRRLVLPMAIALSGCGAGPIGTPVDLPGGPPGIGFDDLRYSRRLHRVFAPASRSGRLDLIDPETPAGECRRSLSAGYEWLTSRFSDEDVSASAATAVRPSSHWAMQIR